MSKTIDFCVINVAAFYFIFLHIFFISRFQYLSTNTLCMSALTAGGQHRFYDTKNLYALSEAIATQSALFESTGKRGAIISR